MKKILIIEDDAPVRKNLVELLTFEGYLPIEAQDGEEGVRLAWETLPDLILCDISMPRLDGYGVLSRVIRDSTTATTPFIFLTARGEREDLRKGMSLGADDYIMKPFSINDVMRAIEMRLDKRARVEAEAEKKRAELSRGLRNGLPGEMLTPLSVILGLSEMLAGNEQCADIESSQVASIGREINQAAGKLLRLIQNYRMYSEIDVIEADPERVQLLRDSRVISTCAIISEIAGLKAQQEHREQDLILQLEDASLCISEIYLQKIIEELLDNAFKFSPSGSLVELTGRVTAERQDDRGQAWFGDHRQYCINVRDQGRGMFPDQVAYLNGASAETQSPVDRQGMGLAIVRRLAQLHGGGFSVQSKPREWTWVEVRIPLAE